MTSRAVNEGAKRVGRDEGGYGGVSFISLYVSESLVGGLGEMGVFDGACDELGYHIPIGWMMAGVALRSVCVFCLM